MFFDLYLDSAHIEKHEKIHDYDIYLKIEKS